LNFWIFLDPILKCPYNYEKDARGIKNNVYTNKYKKGEKIMVMKCIRVMLLALLIAAPLQANAADCDEYSRLLNNFYRLDQQDFKSISCNIDSPTLTNSLSQLRIQLSPLRDKVDIKENLATFSLTYARSGGLKINKPAVDVRIISEEGMPDPATAQRGIEMINNGFREQIEGISMQIEGIFEGFEPLNLSDCKIEEMTEDNGVYTVKYEKGNSRFTEIYSENQRRVKQVIINDGEISTLENYEKFTNGKLALTNSHVAIDQDMGKMEMDVALSYENVKGVLFPSRIHSHVKQSVQTFLQEAQTDIHLRNCALE
jgi:hypothetical protein